MNEVNDNEEEGGRKWRGTKLSPVAIPPPRSTEDEKGGKGGHCHHSREGREDGGAERSSSQFGCLGLMSSP